MANHLHHLHHGAQREKNPAQGAEVLKFFDWAYKTGGKQANELDYATLPKKWLSRCVRQENQRKDSSGKALY